jgi:hypothetical protein
MPKVDALPWYWSDRILEYEETGCWLWIGCLGHAGYGVLQHNHKQTSAHRIIYEFFHGALESRYVVLDHLCRVKPCVNPDHLEPVTQRENVHRGLVGDAQRARHSAKTHCVRGHPLSGENLATGLRAGYVTRRCRECSRLRCRKAWKEGLGDRTPS